MLAKTVFEICWMVCAHQNMWEYNYDRKTLRCVKTAYGSVLMLLTVLPDIALSLVGIILIVILVFEWYWNQ